MCQTDDRLATFGLDILENSVFSEFEEDITTEPAARCYYPFAMQSPVFKGIEWGEVQRITSLRDTQI